MTMSIMQIVVFAKKEHMPFITHIQTEYTKTGFGGTYGNKVIVAGLLDSK